MTRDDIQATLRLCLMAAFADDLKHERERAQIRQVAEGLGADESINLPGLYQDVLLRRIPLPEVLAQLTDPQARQVAYEMAVCVCEADGDISPQELRFLAQVRAAWGMEAAASADSEASPATGGPADLSTRFAQTAHSVADAPLNVTASQDGLALDGVAPHPAAVDAMAPSSPTASRPSTLSAEAMDRKILRASIINGAIELLPENLSTLAIIPLQMRLVYQIGESYGYDLDRGQIKTMLLALGVGLTSQYLEGAGRKLLGRLLGTGLLGGLGRQAISSGMSFASTYAIGHVANQYYAGGQQWSKDLLKTTYQHVLQEAHGLEARYLPQIRETARHLDTGKVLAMVRGQD